MSKLCYRPFLIELLINFKYFYKYYTMALLSDSIHLGSMSPSKTIHFDLLSSLFDNSRIYFDSKPSFQSFVIMFTDPYKSSLDTALGSILTIVKPSDLLYVSASDFQT